MPTQRIAVRIPRNQTDPDAQAFITAAGITDSTQQSAINTLVTNLKAYGIWTKMKALYPMVGGTAASHKFNLKDPRDLDAAFRLVFNGGWTHSANGATPNGTNGYANTFYLPSTQASQNNHHVSAYSRTNNTNFFGLIGAANNNIESARSALFAKADSNTWQSLNSNGYLQWSDSNSLGHYISNRTASNVMSGWKDGVKKGTQTSASITPATNNYFIGAISIGAIYGTASFYSNRQTSFASIGDGLTDTEAANFYSAVQAFQTTLGRSIGTQTVSDADAQAFINAAVIDDQVQATAINNFVVGLKADSIWTKMKALYPFVGGTSTSHKFNLKDPRDLDVAFRLQFNGGWTHSVNGALPNGTNAYADTKLSPSGQLSISSAHFSKYNRTNDLVGVKIDGVADNVPNFFQQNFSSANGYIGDGASLATYTPTDTRGLITTTRTANNLIKVFRNSSQIAINNTTTITAIPIASPFIGARNNGGGIGQFYNTYQCAFASIGDGLNDTEAANFYTRVQAFQTTLGRQV